MIYLYQGTNKELSIDLEPGLEIETFVGNIIYFIVSEKRNNSNYLLLKSSSDTSKIEILTEKTANIYIDKTDFDNIKAPALLLYTISIKTSDNKYYVVEEGAIKLEIPIFNLNY